MCDAFPVVVAAGWLLPTIPGCRRRPGPMTVRGACFVSTTILPMSFDRGYTLPAATVLAIVDRTVKFIEIRLGVLARAQAGSLEHLTRRERFRLDTAPLYEEIGRASCRARVCQYG